MRNQFPQIDMCKTGQNIKQIMIEQDVTVRDIQEYLGLAAPQSIYHWFEGRSLPTVDNLYALSELFHMPMDMLVCGNRKRKFYLCEHPAYRLRIYYDKFQELQAG